MAGVAVGVGAFRERHGAPLEAREALMGRLRELVEARDALAAEMEERLALSEALGASELRFRVLAEEALTGVYLIQDGVCSTMSIGRLRRRSGTRRWRSSVGCLRRT